jgi:DNA 3'-phosphatase
MPADYKPKSTGKFYLFDLDGTLTYSRSGKTHARDAADAIIRPGAAEKLAELSKAGYNILIVSNQSYWTPATKAKIEHIFTVLSYPFFIAIGHGSPCRKPAPALWLKYLDLCEQPSVQELHMCGDASGPTSSYPPYRWASSDRDFATAIGAVFHEPLDIFNPYTLPKAFPQHPTITLMVGNPGSGKSTFSRQLAALTGHELLEQDTYPNRTKLLKVVKAFAEAGKSVIVDATHGSKARRDELYAIADANDAVKRVFWMTRDGRAFNSLRDKPIPPVAYAVYTKHFADPRDDGVPLELVY